MQVSANGIAIELDDQGPPGGEPLLLIMGLGMQLIAWPQEWVDQLVARGFRVIRFDNRDAGLSTGFDALGVPNLLLAGLGNLMHMPVAAPYRIADMAADAIGVLDALGLASAHVCGASMGGMIGQHLAAAYPERVRSLCLMMTTSGSRRLPQPELKVQRALLSRPASAEPEAVVAHLERLVRLIGSPGYPPAPELLRQRLRLAVERAWHPAGTARQMAAVIADGSRTRLLGAIVAPTRVVHGQSDPLIPVAAGHDLVARIHGAVGDFVPGMGHDLPQELLPHFTAGVAENAARWSSARA
ncbi:MAG: alpha/beta fold hydrolase [Burkholderiales bacterium]|nr:alpha/beta fold hydrolase [Burkholderiales bacterium]